MERTQLAVLQHAQIETFEKLLKDRNQNTPKKFPHNLRKLCPFVDEEGTIQLKGRLKLSWLSVQAKHPVLQSVRHLLVIVILRQAFEDIYHEGTEYVRDILQQDVWIMGFQNVLRSVKHQYVICRKIAPPIHIEMTDLPKKGVR